MRVFVLTFRKFGVLGREVAVDVFAEDEKEAIKLLKKDREVVAFGGTHIEVLKEVTSKPHVGRWYNHIPDYDDDYNDGQVKKRRKKRVSKRARRG